ncbi:MAG TPA: hypothetical protein VMG82_34085, partial [Candidatus Sulfotelmatobacter sp.]|nr:hypothetical protein [Candidatus Sulfotelmatobacter sp.]
MKRHSTWELANTILLCWLMVASLAGIAFAQADSAAQADQAAQLLPASTTLARSATAVGYQVGGGTSKVDLKGTELMPQANGGAKVEIKDKAGKSNIEVSLKDMKPATTLGAEFLTYVLWVVTPEGRTGNTGEIILNKNGEGKLTATTPAQTFSLIVTAEPYFSVRVPSEMVVLESATRKDTKGKIFPVSEY